jgi:4-hydroxy-tetrahydrodipicolinate synthase
MTALVTPFRDGQIDWVALEGHVNGQIEAGVEWLVPCGTTGESPTLTEAEHEEVLGRVVQWARGRSFVMAGTGSYDSAEAVRRTQQAASMGADAALVVTPYYNRPSPEGLYRHYACLAESAELPIVIYNVPARTGVSIPNDVVVRLRQNYPCVAAIKHATGSVDGVTDLLNRSDIAVLSGDDAITWPLMALGATGVVSVLSNLCPELMRSLVNAGLSGDISAARQHHAQVHEISMSIGRYGPNPVPIKTAMAIQGRIQEEFRLPLCPVDAEARSAIAEVLRRHGLLNKVAA